jgi:hypothetical protein
MNYVHLNNLGIAAVTSGAQTFVENLSDNLTLVEQITHPFDLFEFITLTDFVTTGSVFVETLFDTLEEVEVVPGDPSQEDLFLTDALTLVVIPGNSEPPPEEPPPGEEEPPPVPGVPGEWGDVVSGVTDDWIEVPA